MASPFERPRALRLRLARRKTVSVISRFRVAQCVEVGQYLSTRRHRHGSSQGVFPKASRRHRPVEYLPHSGHPLTGPCQEAIEFFRNPLSVASSCNHNFQPPVFLQTLTASVFSLRWLRTESRQSPIRFKHVAMYCDRPGGRGRPRETLVPSRVQGVGHTRVAVALATPVRYWLTTWAIQSSALHRVAQRRRPITRVVVHQTASWLTVFGQTITQSSAAHRRASARAACGSTPARACARAP